MDTATPAPEDLEGVYELLGIGLEMSFDEVRARYLELAKQAHPDAGGSDDEMARLTEAYETVLSARRAQSTALVERAAELMPLPPLAIERRRERRDDAKRVMEEVLRHQTSSLKQARRQGTWAAIACGGIALVVAFTQALGLHSIETVKGEDYVWLTPTIRISLVALFGALGAFFGLLSWKASARATWIETALEDLGDALSDKNSYLQLIDELCESGGLGPDWTRDELITAIGRWTASDEDRRQMPRHFVARSLLGLVSSRNRDLGIPLRGLAEITGPVDLAILVISKGLERDLIEERRSADGQRGYRYSLAG